MPTHAVPRRKGASGRAICVALALLGGLSSSAQAVTWYTNPANGHQYAVTSNRFSWTQAQAEAVSLGGHLVTLTTREEEAWFESIFTTGFTGVVYTNLWMGMTDLGGPDGRFRWITGEPVTYTNWRHGNPDNIGVEHYVLYFQGVWDNRTEFDQAPPVPGSPHRLKYGVIERGTPPMNHIASVPEPSSIALASVGLATFVLVGLRRRRG